MIVAWVLITSAVITMSIGGELVTPPLLVAAFVFYVNGRFGWLTRAWHVGDDWPWWARGGDDWPVWARFLWGPQISVAIIFASVVALLLALFYAALR